VLLEHTPQQFLVFPQKTTFSINDKKYIWKKDSDVFEDGTNSLIGQYQENLAKRNDNKIGTLVLREVNSDLTDLVVISAIALQLRSEKQS